MLKIERLGSGGEGQILLEREFILKFSPSGNYLALLQTDIRKKNKPYQLRNIKVPLFVQSVSILSIEKSCLDLGKSTEIARETKLLKTHYSDKRAKMLDFLNQNELKICLIFDDELLCLGMSQNNQEFTLSFKIKFLALSKHTPFLGLYKKTYLFSRLKPSSQTQSSLGDVEYIDKSAITELIDEKEIKNESEDDGVQKDVFDPKKNSEVDLKADLMNSCDS